MEKQVGKVYVFSYGTLQDENFYKNIFSPETRKFKATLNGYAKCMDETNYFLIKKDIKSSVVGTVFEITSDELFAIDRWELFPQYSRFLETVYLEDEQDVLEEVYVYTKLEIGKYAIVPKEYLNSKDPRENETNLKSFLEIEKLSKDLPIFDGIFLFEASDEHFELIEKMSHPYFALIFTNNKIDEKSPISLILNTTAICIEDSGKKYIALTIFGRKDFATGVHYWSMFFDDEIKDNFEIKLTSLISQFKDVDKSWFSKDKLKYILTYTKNKEPKQKKLEIGIFQKAFNVQTNIFELDPFERFNRLLTIFFDYKKAKDF
ncbi:gamma-glutamyl AIG2-like cyclotransferase [Metamycoplasma subdolum]|uniref:Gamma-glutamyl AIG2-like cyclotransferase n=1 Tax=Metamycoplasma subdolum TaxID=92407 RepID=A0A3L9ZYE7_9BACT|nr:gamma-glutamylcyclotransferase family protein [Metamycoplasma subdolum]RMA77470.1 gamma-glutamyl AIG2-like cyclotransferase [Metamycoplasma subdolum]WPB50669.1 gamma-glutamylcyclotransferase family protein [Metamycoplasma subdolum]